MGLFKKYVSQTRKPEGFLGRLMVDGMNGGHAKLADWGMAFLPDFQLKTILDVGCGGGRNIGSLLKRFSAAKGVAVDYSPVSVEKSKRHNRNLIDAGRCSVLRADVASLPFDDCSFDLVTAFETVYFWPGIEACFAEVCRVLKTVGTFLICNESDGTDENGLKFEKIIDGMKCYTAEEITTALKKAGFTEVKTDRRPDKPWLTVTGRK